MVFCFFFQAEDGIRDLTVTGVQTCALPISSPASARWTWATCRSSCMAGERKSTRLNSSHSQISYAVFCLKKKKKKKEQLNKKKKKNKKKISKIMKEKK